jgi:hypothetical protein
MMSEIFTGAVESKDVSLSSLHIHMALFCICLLYFRSDGTSSSESDEDDDSISIEDMKTDTDSGSDADKDEESDMEEEDSTDLDEESADSSSSDDETGMDDEPLLTTSIDPLSIGQLLRRCRKIIGIIKHSSVLHAALRAFAPSDLNADLVLDVEVRWGSTLKMIQRLIMYRAALTGFMDELPSIPGVTPGQKTELIRLNISDDDWNVVDALQNVLQVFSDATVMLSGSNYPSLAIAYPVLDSLKYFLDSASDDPDENSMKVLLQKSFNHYIDRSKDSTKYQHLLVRNCFCLSVHRLLGLPSIFKCDSQIASEI